MITLESFIGALMQQLAMARQMSDGASVHIAEGYLQNELLKGFPVPRMQLRDVEMELNFGVASKLESASFLEDDEVQKNLTYQLQDLLSSFPSQPEFKDYFSQNAPLQARWKAGLASMSQRFAQILSRPASDPVDLAHSLALSVQNYFYETAAEEQKPAVAPLLLLLVKPSPFWLAQGVKPESETVPLQKLIESRIAAMLRSLQGAQQAPGAPAPMALNVLVGTADLGKLDTALLNKIKITINPSDLRWIVSEKNSQKIYTLGS